MRIPAIVALGLGLAAASGTRADIPPLPGERERQFLDVIESAGHPCAKVGSFKYAGSEEIAAYAKAWLDPFVVECANGKTYLVAIPYHRPRLDSDGNIMPPPAPVVKEMAR
jgi:hypothetical protein